MTPWPHSTALALTLLASVALILAYETLAALLARRLSIPYGKLLPLQLGLYLVIGFVAMLALLDIRQVELVGAVTGFVQATLGWAISWRIGPGRIAKATPDRIALTVLVMTVFGFGLAIVGAIAFNITARLLLTPHS